MGEGAEKVTLPFDDFGENETGLARTTDGALALSPGEISTTNVGAEAARLADLAHSWGITIPADFIPATKAQVAYWRELCGAISPTGTEGMKDGTWPTYLAPAMADGSAQSFQDEFSAWLFLHTRIPPQQAPETAWSIADAERSLRHGRQGARPHRSMRLDRNDVAECGPHAIAAAIIW